MSASTTAGSGQTNRDPLVGPQMFLAHESEPQDSYQSFDDEDVKKELYENRFFLKHRVWRNMRKVRRHPQIQRHPQSQYKHRQPALGG